MKNSAVKFLVFASMLIFAWGNSEAKGPEHFPPTWLCADCHQAHKDLGDTVMFSNVCLSCHKPGNPDNYAGKGYIRSFVYGDQANPFNNDPGLNSSPNALHSSHRWSGADTVPEAGAQWPNNSNMYNVNKPMFKDNLYCSRCHNILNDTPSGATWSDPYLRGLNDTDQMCVDCHRSRNTTNVMTGTHPVNVLYSSATSKSRLQPDNYYPRPMNANTANPTSQLPMKNGLLVCSSCHGLHYADSNSATFDGFSSAVFGGLSTSKGYLLRTDYKRKSSAERNICMNCHRSNDLAENTPLQDGVPTFKAAVKNHNGKTRQQNIQCVDCHGGHVAFPGYSSAQYGRITANDQIPNIYLINRFMNVSGPGLTTVRNAKVLFNDAATKNAKGPYGVCVACHSTLPTSVSQHANPRNDLEYCKSCHTHQAGFSADCTSCHGFPPTTNTPGGTTGYANAGGKKYTDYVNWKDESATPHGTHAGGGTGYSYQCDQCHRGNNHADGVYTDVFRTTAGNISPLAQYSSGKVGTCTTVYCHSDGKGNYQTVTWANGKGTIAGQTTPKHECTFCHNYPPASGTNDAHIRHTAGGTTGKLYSCATCHNATVTDVPLGGTSYAVVKDQGKHVNGAKDLAFSGSLANGASITGCITCHNNGKGGNPNITPSFSDVNSGKCGACHSNPMTNFGHPAHLNGAYGPQFIAFPPSGDSYGCTPCHPFTGELSADHINGPVSVSQPVDLVSGACTTCHPAGKPTWTAGPVSCESCHSGTTRSVFKTAFSNITAPDKRLAAVSGHNATNLPNDGGGTRPGPAKLCLDCHARDAAHLNPDPKMHTFRLLTTLSTSSQTSNKPCTYCHNDATKVTQFLNMSTHFTAKGGPQAMQCWQCHELHGTTNRSMVRTSIAYINSTSWTISFQNRSTAWIDKVTNRGICQVCHTKTSHYRAGITDNSHPDKNCFECHKHNSAGGAFKPVGGCNGCHGYPPVPKSAVKGTADPNNYKGTFGVAGNYESAGYEDYSGGGGAHLWHVAQTAKQSDGWLHCAKCHSGGSTNPSTHRAKTPVFKNISNVTINFESRYRFSDATLPSYSGARLANPPKVNQTGSCVNIMCHFQPTPRWSKDR